MARSKQGSESRRRRWPWVLLGLGVRTLSMNASAIPRVKQSVRALDIGDCARFARRVMEQSDPARIRELVAGFAEGVTERA